MTEQIVLEEARKLARIADEVCTEWSRWGNLKPEMIKRLQLAVDDFYEVTE